jgi:flagellar basal-body rod protein FlgB
MKIATNDGTVGLLRQALDETALRTAISASNMANVDTPGYRSLEVSFPTLLAASSVELRSTDPAHFAPHRPPGGALVDEAPIGRMRPDGNTVDIDMEMTRLAFLQGRFTAATQLVRHRFAMLRYAVEGVRS